MNTVDAQLKLIIMEFDRALELALDHKHAATTVNTLNVLRKAVLIAKRKIADDHRLNDVVQPQSQGEI